MSKRYTHDVTGNKTKDMQKRMARMRKHSHDLPFDGDDEEFLRIQKKNSVINVTLAPTTWSQVIALAFTYALLINIIKHFLYATYGTPQFEFSDPKLEAEYTYLEEKYGDASKKTETKKP